MRNAVLKVVVSYPPLGTLSEHQCNHVVFLGNNLHTGNAMFTPLACINNLIHFQLLADVYHASLI